MLLSVQLAGDVPPAPAILEWRCVVDVVTSFRRIGSPPRSTYSDRIMNPGMSSVCEVPWHCRQRCVCRSIAGFVSIFLIDRIKHGTQRGIRNGNFEDVSVMAITHVDIVIKINRTRGARRYPIALFARLRIHQHLRHRVDFQLFHEIAKITLFRLVLERTELRSSCACKSETQFCGVLVLYSIGGCSYSSAARAEDANSAVMATTNDKARCIAALAGNIRWTVILTTRQVIFAKRWRNTRSAVDKLCYSPSTFALLRDEFDVMRNVVADALEQGFERKCSGLRMVAGSFEITCFQFAQDRSHLSTNHRDQFQFGSNRTMLVRQPGGKSIRIAAEKRGATFRNHALHAVSINRFEIGDVANNLTRRPLTRDRRRVKLVHAHDATALATMSGPARY